MATELEDLRITVTSRFGLAPTEGLASELRHRSHSLAERRGVGLHELVRQAEQDPALLRELAGAMTIGESHFFRIPEHFAHATEIVRERAALRLITRIVSVGCARGEEPYSMALALLDGIGEWVRPLVHIVAADLNLESLEIAHSRCYSAWSMRSVPDELHRRYFRRCGSSHCLDAALASWVEFRHLSARELLERLEPGTADIVFFRNVGIYLTESSLREIYAAIAQALVPSGVLLLAVTDPPPTTPLLSRRADLLGGYARREMIAVEGNPIVLRPAPRESLRPARKPRHFAPRSSRRPPTLVPRLVATSGATGTPDESHRFGAYRATTSASLLSRARARLEQGIAGPATEDLRAALYLAPDDHLTRFLYCVALLTDAQTTRAVQQLRTLRRALAGLDTEVVLSDGRTTALDLNEALCELEEVFG